TVERADATAWRLAGIERKRTAPAVGRAALHAIADGVVGWRQERPQERACGNALAAQEGKAGHKSRPRGGGLAEVRAYRRRGRHRLRGARTRDHGSRPERNGQHTKTYP